MPVNTVEALTCPAGTQPALRHSELPNRRIGADVRAKINCGKRSLGYVLFGDVVEFVQKHLWL